MNSLSVIAQLTDAANERTVAGILILGILGLVSALVYIYKTSANLAEKKSADYASAMATKDKAIMQCREDNTAERERHAAELEELRAEYEEKHRIVVEKYAADIVKERGEMRAREDMLRKDYTERVERMSAEMAKVAGELGPTLDKIFERFIGPRRTPPRGG